MREPTVTERFLAARIRALEEENEFLRSVLARKLRDASEKLSNIVRFELERKAGGE